MTEEEFWNIVGKLNWALSGDDEGVVEPVIDYLAKKSNEEIFEFEEILAQKLFKLDSMAHAKAIGEYAYSEGEDNFSVDGFLYSRCVVVANGRELYEEVVRQPEKFPTDLEFEPLLYLAQDAFERKNDEEWDYVSPTDYETGRNKEGWK